MNGLFQRIESYCEDCDMPADKFCYLMALSTAF